MEWQSPVIGAWVEVRIYPTPAGITAYFHDISERKRKEAERDQYLAALRESEQRLRFHLENTSMAVVEWDAQFIVTRWAGEAEMMFGWSEAETVGKPIMGLNMIFEDDIAIVEATMARLTDGVSHKVVSSNRNVTKDGRVIDCTWYNSVLLDSGGAMASVMSLVLDTTQSKQAQEALRASQERFRSLFDSMLEGVAYCRMLFDEDGRPNDWLYLDVNPAFERLTGLKDMVGRRVVEAIPGIRESNPELFEAYGRVATSGRPDELEIDFSPLNMWLRISVFSPQDQHFVAVFEDISERKRADQKRQRVLEESQAQGEKLQAQSKDLRERTDQLANRVALDESLEKINHLIYSTLAVDEIMQRALDEGMAALHADGGSIEMREGESWSVRYQRGLATQGAGLRLSEAEALVATRAARLQEPVAIDDLSPEAGTGAGFLRARGLRSALAVPLLVRGAVVGCLLFCGATPRVFTAGELDFSAKLGSVVSLSLENARLSEGEREAAQIDETLTGSRTTRTVRWLRFHPWHVLLASIAIEIAFLASIAALKDPRRILGLPGSLLALTAVVAGAPAGPLVGALVALAGGITFFATVADYGSRVLPVTHRVSTGDLAGGRPPVRSSFKEPA